MENSVIITWITSLYVSQPSSVFFACKTAHFGPEFHSLWVPALICSFCMPNSEFWTRITSLYVSQTLPVLLCMQNSLICTRISSLYGFQHSSVVMSTKNSVLNTIDYIGSYSHLSFRACKSVWLAPELLDSMGPSPHVWFLDAKQQLMDRNNKTLWVPDITCRFVLAKQRDLHQNVKFIWVPALICVFFHAKQRLYDQTYKSVWVPDFICGFEQT